MYENKKYLDSEGLKALIIKIAEIYKDQVGIAKDVGGLVKRVDDIYKENEDGTKTGLLEEVRTAVEAIRKEIGEAADATAESIYTRLNAIEKAATELEPRVEEVEKKSVTKLSSEYRTADKVVVVTAKNAKGEDLADATFEINTTDFVVDGMIKQAVMVSAIHPEGYNAGLYVVGTDTPVLAKEFLFDATDGVEASKEAAKIWSDENVESQVWWDNNAGKKFILMRFNTSKGGGNADSVRGYKDILIDTQILFNDTEYKVKNEATKLFDFEVETEQANKDDNNVLTVTYKLKATEDAVKVVELVLDPAKGNEKLRADIDAANEEIKKIVAANEEQDKKIETLNTTVEAQGKQLEDIDKFIRENAIPVKEFIAVFDYYVHNKKNPPLDSQKEPKWFIGAEDYFESDGGKIKNIWNDDLPK